MGLTPAAESAARAADLADFPRAAYPALFQAADAAATVAQRAHVRLVAIELLLVILGAALGSAAAFDASLATVMPMFAGASFLAAAALKVVERDRRYDRQWLDARAIAETVRTTAWQYMMRVPPYDDDATADEAFATALRASLEARPNLTASLTTSPAGSRQISADMRAERARPVSERRDRYRAARLADQIAWYRRKGAGHTRRASQFFWLALAAQLGALLVAGVSTAQPALSRFNLLGVLAAIASTATAISQLNRHDDLARTYGLAFQELSLIDGLAETAKTEAALRRVVSDGEGVIAREHKLWLGGSTGG